MNRIAKECKRMRFNLHMLAEGRLTYEVIEQIKGMIDKLNHYERMIGDLGCYDYILNKDKD